MRAAISYGKEEVDIVKEGGLGDQALSPDHENIKN